MTSVHYKVVQHDGGWTYMVGDVFAETFPTRAAAKAAERAAAEHRVPTPPHDEDEKGRWRIELSDGTPPDTDVR